MSGDIKQLLSELKGRLAGLYGQRLRGVYLFGSHARGEADEESDVDVLIVLDRVDGYCGEVDRTGGLIADLSLRYGVSISRVFATEAQWRADTSAFYESIREEAVPA